MDRCAVSGLGIAYGRRDLGITNVGDGIVHGLDILIHRELGVDHEHRGEGLQHGTRGHDSDLLAHAGGSGGLGGHADIAVVGKDDDVVGVGVLDGGEDVGRGGIHRLAALNDNVDTERMQDGCRARTGGNGHEAERLARAAGGNALIGRDFGRTVRRLEIHVVDKDLKNLAAMQHMTKHVVGSVGMDVDLVVGIGAHKKLAVTHRG